MSAAAGPVMVSPDAMASREQFIQDPTVNSLCFSVVNSIAKELNKNRNLRFFVKGGAAAVLSLVGDPLAITNDIDCSVLVNPTLKSDGFERNRIYAVEICIEKIVGALNTMSTDVITKIRSACTHYGLELLTTPPPIRVGHAAPDGYALLEGVNTFIARDKPKFNPDCPLFIDVWPSLMFGSTSLQMAVIKLRTHTTPSLDILDIALPAKTYERLPYEWEQYKTDPFTVHRMRIPILNPLTQIENQAYAESKTVRGLSAAHNAKGTRRRKRLDALRRKFLSAVAPSPTSVLASMVVSAAGGAGAGAGAGGAGAVAPGYSLSVINERPSGRSNNRRRTTTRRNASAAPAATPAASAAASAALAAPAPASAGTTGRVLTYSLIPIIPEVFNKIREGREVIVLRNPRTGKPLQFKEGNIPRGAMHNVYRNERNGRVAQIVYWGTDGHLHRVGNMAILNPKTFELTGVVGNNGREYKFE
jgi:hypothetical protein